jgi:hypothetical protein
MSMSVNLTFQMLLSYSRTYVCKPIDSCLIIRRDMKKSNSVASQTNLLTYRNSTQNSTQVLRRHYASAHGGKLRPAAPKSILTDTGLKPLDSDTTGFHKVGILSVCSNPACKNANCANPINVNPCGVSHINHQRVTSLPSFIRHEFVGAITHRIPPYAKGNFLSHLDIHNNSSPQFIIKEEGTLQ